jgi:hypothetical protein
LFVTIPSSVDCAPAGMLKKAAFVRLFSMGFAPPGGTVNVPVPDVFRVPPVYVPPFKTTVPPLNARIVPLVLLKARL